MTVRQILDELGVYAAPKRGKPRTYSTPEEAHQVKLRQMKNARLAAKAVNEACKAAGIEPPQRKRGRPRIYATREESLAVRNAQNEICRKRLEARVEEALWRLGSLLEAARSHAQENNVAHL